jgi:hypothetical protein
VVVHDFNVEGIRLTPHKAEAVLVVDANAVLPFTIPRMRFKAIAARNCQIGQIWTVSFFIAATRILAGMRRVLPVSQRSFVSESLKLLITEKHNWSRY